MEQRYYVYIIRCKDNSLYTGITTDIGRRFQEHCGMRAGSAKYTRAHNDANALCLGGRVVGPGLAIELVDVFLNTPFEGGRHSRRVDKLTALEEQR